ncbi:hypothetical protein BBO99_00005568 [Phytophthora kernoviae]|uniref:Uncharacterized protein n=2 Tax=Phytophthora kernoviae TaxID=325452 RepID=A0A3R7JT93_9STRA|nr:hypothetical protein G195_008594 [Phytophthora kernoviae 00238/432]KAG2514644.1 hypothetical protein JM16_007819 [Phytophthora kernoviae]KAG2516550.1 hypothetical protein JM18_007749 [Phytophthora kernoviae]RLN15041.1 hypothetical protein BBI17_005457 [Phytophthora kernoviae]RLN79006.1 hypothetical protein BBO99_00005568 [Phytophthora kernoviae]
MPARSASGGEGSPSVSPSRPSANQTTSSGFSSAPVAPVVANSHSRRRKGDAGWLKSGTADAQNQNGNDGSSPSSSGTQDEDIRSKSRPGSAESQNSSSSKKEDATMGDEDDAPLVHGDAEDLSIDSTLQILIQNEIERADPAQVPPVISLLFKKGGYPEAAEYHRRFVDSPLWRERGDSYLSVDRTLDAHPRNRARAEGRFPHRINPRNAVDGAHASGTSSGTPTGYKYRDSMDSPSGGQTSPMTGIPGYPQYAPLRTKHDITAGDYRINDVVSRSSAAPRVSRETASFMSPTDTLGHCSLEV